MNIGVSLFFKQEKMLLNFDLILVSSIYPCVQNDNIFDVLIFIA